MLSRVEFVAGFCVAGISARRALVPLRSSNRILLCSKEAKISGFVRFASTSVNASSGGSSSQVTFVTGISMDRRVNIRTSINSTTHARRACHLEPTNCSALADLREQDNRSGLAPKRELEVGQQKSFVPSPNVHVAHDLCQVRKQALWQWTG